MADDWDTLLEKATRSFRNTNFGADVKFNFENGRNVHITADGTTFSVVPDSAANARAELSMTYNDASLIINRKLSPIRAITTFRLKVRGDMSVAFKVAELLTRPLPDRPE